MKPKSVQKLNAIDKQFAKREPVFSNNAVEAALERKLHQIAQKAQKEGVKSA
jgi:hypothetical protein